MREQPSRSSGYQPGSGCLEARLLQHATAYLFSCCGLALQAHHLHLRQQQLRQQQARLTAGAPAPMDLDTSPPLQPSPPTLGPGVTAAVVELLGGLVALLQPPAAAAGAAAAPAVAAVVDAPVIAADAALAVRLLRSVCCLLPHLGPKAGPLSVADGTSGGSLCVRRACMLHVYAVCVCVCVCVRAVHAACVYRVCYAPCMRAACCMCVCRMNCGCVGRGWACLRGVFQNTHGSMCVQAGGQDIEVVG